MHTGRALTIFLAVVGVALIWTGIRYALPGEMNAGSSHHSAATLRFFRNPAVVPAFAANDLDGRPISSASLKGKVILVNFWATWCPPCRAEIPDLIALQDKYGDALQIIGVSQDEVPPEQVKQFAIDHKMNYPVVMSTKGIESLFPGVRALPTSFVIDREGRLVQKHVGMLNAETTELEARALAGLPVDVSIEEVDQSQGLSLANGAQAIEIPGVDLTSLSADKRTEALKKLNAQSCTCGCDLTIARCRVDDPTCGVSLPIARQIVQQVAQNR